jgi:hypothetical protein
MYEKLIELLRVSAEHPGQWLVDADCLSDPIHKSFVRTVVEFLNDPNNVESITDHEPSMQAAANAIWKLFELRDNLIG